MSPQIEAAIIAGSFGVLTLIGTLAAQLYGIRKTSSGTEKTLKQQSEQLDTTLAEQRGQLDRTLREQRDRTLNERFATAADRLGSDKPPAVRLAGVYAMAGLADDWPENRQTCVDVLCAYLRLPYEPEPGNGAPAHERLSFGASREVRHTVIRVITAHLRADAGVSWQGLNFDFTGVVFDGGDFSRAEFSDGEVSFGRAEFSGGEVSFERAEFSGSTVIFVGAEFSSGEVSFRDTTFSDGPVDFDYAEFCGADVDFGGAEFSGGDVNFRRAEFSGGKVNFGSGPKSVDGVDVYSNVGARFSGGKVSFAWAKFSGGKVDFVAARFSGSEVSFERAKFSGGELDFKHAEFSGSEVGFHDLKFSGGEVGLRFAGVLRRRTRLHERRVLRRPGRLRSRPVLRKRGRFQPRRVLRKRVRFQPRWRLVSPTFIPLDRQAAPRCEASPEARPTLGVRPRDPSHVLRNGPGALSADPFTDRPALDPEAGLSD
jgi:uncharacterized protein YjbI with pentapeptide repeats